MYAGVTNIGFVPERNFKNEIWSMRLLKTASAVPVEEVSAFDQIWGARQPSVV
jgi:hypothetical protein